MPREMRKSFGDLPTCLFPLAGVDMLTMLYKKYKDAVDVIYVIAYEKEERIEQYIRAKKLPIRLVVLDQLNDLGYTIQYGLTRMVRDVPDLDYVYINFADSFLEDALPPADRDFAYYAERDMDESWTWFKESDGRITDIFDKGDFEAGKIPDRDFRKLFVGVFGIASVTDLLDTLQQMDRGRSIDSLYQAVWKYSAQHNFSFLMAANWFDVGHNENYIQAKTKVEARAFNSIKIDEERGILTKTSENKEKLIHEIRWYLRMPAPLQYLLPRIYDYSLDYSHPFVSMEYYGYHTLHESLVYGDLSFGEWKKIFKKLLFIVKDMQTFRISGREQEIHDAAIEMYLNKTEQRLEKLRHQEEFEKFFEHPIILNGIEYPSLDQTMSALPRYVQSLLVDDSEEFFTIIHGDLCFTNILVEDNYNFMRIIDPRGKFGAFDIYGDSRYELAKIMHSLEGHYDDIIEDRFDVKVEDTAISYNLQMENRTALDAFLDTFSEELTNLRAVRLIEATLFLSMIPLHDDHLDRQYLMLATGVKLFHDVVEEGKR